MQLQSILQLQFKLRFFFLTKTQVQLPCKNAIAIQISIAMAKCTKNEKIETTKNKCRFWSGVRVTPNLKFE